MRILTGLGFWSMKPCYPSVPSWNSSPSEQSGDQEVVPEARAQRTEKPLLPGLWEALPHQVRRQMRLLFRYGGLLPAECHREMMFQSLAA